MIPGYPGRDSNRNLPNTSLERYRYSNLLDLGYLQLFIDYVLQVKCQQMSHAVRYGKFCKSRNFQHLALVGMILYLILLLRYSDPHSWTVSERIYVYEESDINYAYLA
jgi:hypothetical protein